MGTEIQYTAASKKEETDRKGTQGHENNMNPRLTFPGRLTQRQKGVSAKKTLPQGAWKGNLFVWWVKFPFEKPPSSLLIPRASTV